MSNTIKNPSPLVKAVLALDNHFSELIRLGEKIEQMELKSNFDFEHVQRMMNHFAECGQGVSTEVILMSNALNEARAKAEAAAQVVSARAEILQARKMEMQKKMDEFRLLGEKVRNLTLSLNDLKRPHGQDASGEDRAKISMRLSELELQIRPLIEEALQLKKEAQDSKMKILEQSADSLRQSLTAISEKLSTFQQSNQLSH